MRIARCPGRGAAVSTIRTSALLRSGPREIYHLPVERSTNGIRPTRVISVPIKARFNISSRRKSIFGSFTLASGKICKPLV